MLSTRISSAVLGSSKLFSRCQPTTVHPIASALVNKRHMSLGELIQRIRFKYFNSTRHHLDNDKWAKIFCVEGNIGSGKAAFAKQFGELLDLRHFPNADIDYQLQRMRGQYPDELIDFQISPESVYKQVFPITIDQFCNDPNDWIHTAKLQLHFLQNRCYQYCDMMAHLLRTGQGVASVRSFYSDFVYAEAQNKMGWLRNDVMKYYDLLFVLADDLLLRPQVVLYLDVPAEQCYENVQAGNNEAEKRLPLEYYKKIEEIYKNIYFQSAEEWYTNVIVLDWSKPKAVEEVIDELDEMKSLKMAFTKWDIKTTSGLKRLLRYAECAEYRRRKWNCYSDIEELWIPKWAVEAVYAEFDNHPANNPIGMNRSLGDKNFFWKSDTRIVPVLM